MEFKPLSQVIATGFVEFGAGDTPISLNVLLRDRKFVGHRFRCGEFHATWEAGSNVIEFFNGTGGLLRTIDLAVHGERKAA